VEKHPRRWLALSDAAIYLGTPVATLRKNLERRATRSEGVTEATLEGGLRARKLCGRWKVWLGTWGVANDRQ